MRRKSGVEDIGRRADAVLNPKRRTISRSHRGPPERPKQHPFSCTVLLFWQTSIPCQRRFCVMPPPPPPSLPDYHQLHRHRHLQFLATTVTNIMSTSAMLRVERERLCLSFKRARVPRIASMQSIQFSSINWDQHLSHVTQSSTNRFQSPHFRMIVSFSLTRPCSSIAQYFLMLLEWTMLVRLS